MPRSPSAIRTALPAASIAAAALLLAALAATAHAGAMPGAAPSDCRAMLEESPRRVRMAAATLLAVVRELSGAAREAVCMGAVDRPASASGSPIVRVPAAADAPTRVLHLGERLLALPPPVA
ncbi:MAG: hypothetical protein KDA22_01135 [Phycisphaerales bacterium]|nr:hypothetical protein [Phycisphaerales bacterium]